MKVNKTFIARSKAWYERRLKQLEKEEKRKEKLKSLKSSTTDSTKQESLKHIPGKPNVKKYIGGASKNNYINPKKLYYKLVWELTENNDLTLLANHDKRGFYNYHLDHIVSISYGYKKGILPSVIADISNLRFIYWRENMRKRANCLPTDLYNETI